jgi:hypothetical protein
MDTNKNLVEGIDPKLKKHIYIYSPILSKTNRIDGRKTKTKNKPTT